MMTKKVRKTLFIDLKKKLKAIRLLEKDLKTDMHLHVLI